MATVDLTRFIIPVELDNTDENQNTGNSAFDTQDYVFFETYDEVKDIDEDEHYVYASDYAVMDVVYASDYAVMNGALLGGQRKGPKDRQSTWHWLRSAYSENIMYRVRSDGQLGYDYA